MYPILNAVQRVFNRNNEQRVLSMLNSSRMPAWVSKAYRAPGTLHMMGVDIVVETNHNKVFLQVKPNYAWARALSKLAQFPLAVIVCNDTTADDHLYMRIMEGLEYGYNRT